MHNMNTNNSNKSDNPNSNNIDNVNYTSHINSHRDENEMEWNDKRQQETGIVYRSGQKIQTIMVGELVLNSSLETVKSSGEFVNNKFMVENLCSIITTLRAHHAKMLSKEQFLGLTIQFPDHYYKINLSVEDRYFIEKFNHMLDKENQSELNL